MTTVPYGKKDSAAALVDGIYTDPLTPYSAMIEIADRCNEVCVHCYQVQGQKGEMSTEELKSVIDQLAEMGVIFLILSGGEPTLRKDFLEIVEYARSLKFAVKIYSNGLNIDAAMAKRMGELAVQEVQLSLYSHIPETHDWVTRVKGSFHRTVAAAEHLVANDIAVVVKAPLMAMNAAGHDEWITLVEGLGADFALDPHLNGREDGSRDPEALRISDEAFLGVKKNPRLDVTLEGRDPQPTTHDMKPCAACQGNVHIEANGELRPCTQLDVPTGHALTDGVAEAFRNNTDAALIRGLTWGDVHGCRECDLRHYCTRCYADSRRESGDALGPYASACQIARLRYEVVFGQAPEVSAHADERDAALGPYRKVEGHHFETIDDIVEARDLALARNHDWLRNGAGSTAPEAALPGELVNIRLPNGRRLSGRLPGGEQSG